MNENLFAKSRSEILRLLRYCVLIISALVACVSLIFVHIDIARAGEDYKGAFLMVDRLFDLFLAIGIASIAFCAGRKIARFLSLSFASVAEEVAFSVMMGVGVIGLGVLCLGLAGLLVPLPVLVFIALLALLCWREGARLSVLAKESAVRATATKLRSTLVLCFIGLIAILEFRALTPPHSPDEAIYHLSVTKLFVQHGRVFPVIDNWAGNMPFLIQMIYAICLMAKADIAAKLMSLCLALVCSFALYGFCRRFLTPRTGLVSMFGFFGAGMVVETAVTSRVDVSLAGMLFLATYAMFVYFQTWERGWLYAAGILSGLSLGIKYTAGIYIILIAIMFLVESILRRQSSFRIIRRGLVYSAIAAAVASPWFVKNFVWFGNPVYPFITGEIVEFAPGSKHHFDAEDQLKLDAHFENARTQMPGLVRERETEMAIAASKRKERHPLRFWEYFIKPDNYAMAEEFQYPNYLFLFCPLIVFVNRSRWLIWLGVFSVAFFIAAVQTSWIARILLPIYPALTLISAHAISELTARSDWGARLRPYISKAKLIPAFAVAAVVGPTALFSIAQSIDASDMSFIKGDLSRTEYMNKFYYYPPSYFINHSTPESSRVLMIGAQTSYDLQRAYIADVNWDSTEWRRLLVRNRSMEELNADLKNMGITHVWVAYGLFTFVAEMGRDNYPNVSGATTASGPDYQAQLMNWAILDLYSSTFLNPIYNDRFGNIIYRIR